MFQQLLIQQKYKKHINPKPSSPIKKQNIINEIINIAKINNQSKRSITKNYTSFTINICPIDKILLLKLLRLLISSIVILNCLAIL